MFEIGQHNQFLKLWYWFYTKCWLLPKTAQLQTVEALWGEQKLTDLLVLFVTNSLTYLLVHVTTSPLLEETVFLFDLFENINWNGLFW